MPLAFTSASSRFIVSLGPKLLLTVISPSAAMACAPDRHIAAINASILRKMVIAYFPRQASPQARSTRLVGARAMLTTQAERAGICLAAYTRCSRGDPARGFSLRQGDAKAKPEEMGSGARLTTTSREQAASRQTTKRQRRTSDGERKHTDRYQ